ncbi:ATP-binding cassette domain-containing protein [Corynebacterium pacaense]|uniref:ATP-binding cassette domain-containing protein n=1 Tax=Corynebacterium pacaense TaxID=1816684 RepID=UPI0009BA0D0F|nr:ABC transporter ATP-binding protein [Corynebacterium pacaense]
MISQDLDTETRIRRKTTDQGPGVTGGEVRTDPIFSVRNLTVSFPGRGPEPVVNGVSLDAHPGEIVALVGQSGSGKSVTARTLIGLAGEDAVVRADEIRLGARNLQELTEKQWQGIRGREIGFVLQDALTSLDPLRRIGKEVGEAIGRAPRAQIDAQVERALLQAGIPDPEIRRRQYSHELSGGLRQRALIASALVNQPGLIIADEPTTALDVTVQKRILELLRALADGGRAILLISHDLAVVSSIADRVLVMRHGEIVESGPTVEVLGRPRHSYTRRLLGAIPSERTRGRKLHVPEGAEAAGTESAAHIHEDTRQFDAQPLFTVRKATVVFPGPKSSRRTALDGVDLHIQPGETLGVVGESGSGKSTLGRAIIGLQKLDEGRIDVFGQQWSALPERRRRPHRHRVQTITQDPLGSFDPQFRVDQLLEQPLRLHSGLDRHARREESLRLLGLVGLDEATLTARPGQLSGGQRQRVSIAQALAGKPDLLIADEPVSALDVITQAQVLDLLQEVQKLTGLAMLFISHDLGVVQHLSHRIAVMKDGRIVEQGTTDEVFRNSRHPYTRELLDAVPTLEAVA